MKWNGNEDNFSVEYIAVSAAISCCAMLEIF